MFNLLREIFSAFVPWFHGVKDLGEAFAAGAETVKLSSFNYRDEIVIQNRAGIKALTKELETS